MDQVFEGIVDRTRSKLDVKSVKTIFGEKHRPHRRREHTKEPRFENVVEKPVYNLTVFKINYDKITTKMYTKGECVLRIEIDVNNTKQLKCGRSLVKFPEMASKLKDILNRFLNTVQYVDASFITPRNLDRLSTPSKTKDACCNRGNNTIIRKIWRV